MAALSASSRRTVRQPEHCWVSWRGCRMIHVDPKRISKADHLLTVGKAHINEKGPQRRGPPASFSRRTLSAVGAFIVWRNDGPCNTDDAEDYLDAVLPLAIQIQNETGCEALPGN